MIFQRVDKVSMARNITPEVIFHPPKWKIEYEKMLKLKEESTQTNNVSAGLIEDTKNDV